jgi:hypothetical protein
MNSGYILNQYIEGNTLITYDISLRMRVWVHKTSLTPPLCFIEVPVASHESEISGIYV